MPVERYAVTFLELQQAPVTQDELQKAEVEIVSSQPSVKYFEMWKSISCIGVKTSLQSV